MSLDVRCLWLQAYLVGNWGTLSLVKYYIILGLLDPLLQCVPAPTLRVIAVAQLQLCNIRNVEGRDRHARPYVYR